MTRSFKVKNQQNELLDVLVEGPKKAVNNTIFVHGFGTDKHETAGLFDDISKAVPKFRRVRFDFSGYGRSQGDQVEGNYHKWAGDLKSILEWAKQFPGQTHVIAQSMGCFITALLSPNDVQKTVMVSIPNAFVQTLIKHFKEYFSKRGVVFNEKGITNIKRSSGQVQQVGPAFWQALHRFKPVKSITNYSKKTDLLVIHPLQDEIIGNEDIHQYREIATLKYIQIPGNHPFTNPADRKVLISNIIQFLK